MRALIVKVSSLGDMVHCTPVVANVSCTHPDVEIDWMIEEGLAGLVHIVHEVWGVIPSLLRRQCKSLGSGRIQGEVVAFHRALRAKSYGAVLDTQSLIRMTLAAAQAKLAPGGFVTGFGNRAEDTDYEPLAKLSYQHKVEMELHIRVVECSRRMVAGALGYTLPDAIDLGLQPPIDLPSNLPRPYVVLVHAISCADKDWSLEAWVGIARAPLARDYVTALPWSSEAERHMSGSVREAIVAAAPGTVGRMVIPPRVSLPDVTAFLDQAITVVGMDTGPVHITAALCEPTMAFYNFTALWRTDGYWTPNVHDINNTRTHPTSAQVLAALHILSVL